MGKPIEDEDDDGGLSCYDLKMLEQIYEEFRRRGDAPNCLREYLYEKIGRTL